MKLNYREKYWKILYIYLVTMIFIMTTDIFFTIFTHGHNNIFLPLLWQFFLIPNRINKLVDVPT